MDPISPENPILNQKKLIEELIHGHELVKELKVILDNPFGKDNYLVANDLTNKILSSFMGSISLMNQIPKDQILESASLSFPDLFGQKEVSSDSSKTSVFKNRKGCYKRRKKSHVSIQIIPNLINDGYAWRKYGQKHIQNTKQPRNYFRCTHRFDQGCQATKQVQKTEHEPPMYRITYHEKHTCRNPFLETPQLVFETTCSNDSQFLINFDSRNKSPDAPTFTKNFPYIKHECDRNMDYYKSQTFDHHTSPDLMTIGSTGPKSVLSSESDQGDMISYFNNGFDHIDMMEGFHGFCDNFGFEFEQYYS